MNKPEYSEEPVKIYNSPTLIKYRISKKVGGGWLSLYDDRRETLKMLLKTQGRNSGEFIVEEYWERGKVKIIPLFRWFPSKNMWWKL